VPAPNGMAPKNKTGASKIKEVLALPATGKAIAKGTHKRTETIGTIKFAKNSVKLVREGKEENRISERDGA